VICSEPFIANLLLSVPVKEFLKLINNWRRYGQDLGVFFDSQCTMYNGDDVKQGVKKFLMGVIWCFFVDVIYV